MAVLVDLTKCIGCRSCVVACKLWNNLRYTKKRKSENLSETVAVEKDELDAENWTVIQAKEFLTEDGKKLLRFVKKQCMHCLDPACASACFSKALRVNENHAVVYYPDLCVGCRYCMIACPFDIPKYQWDKTFPLIEKCQYCADRLAKNDMPACVSVCPIGALRFGEREKLLRQAHAILRKNPKYINHIYGEKEAGGSSWLYISDQPFEKLGFKTDIEEVSPTTYTKSYLSKVPVLAPLWGLFLTGLAIYHGRKAKNGEEGKEEDDE